MTGIASGEVLKYDLKIAARCVISMNEEVSKIIGINKAARTTTIKPSGTTSCVLGTSSGIHAWHNDYYIRRIRLTKNDPLYTYVSKVLPALVEDDKLQFNTAVLSIPQKAPEGSILRTESALDLLERVKKFNIEWVKAGHRKGDNTNNVSATISIDKSSKYMLGLKKYKDDSEVYETYQKLTKDFDTSLLSIFDEWQVVGEWMWKNKDTFNGLSVLPYDNGSYIQAPFSDCTKEEYEHLASQLHALDLSQVKEEDDNTDLSGEVACGGNGCEVR